MKLLTAFTYASAFLTLTSADAPINNANVDSSLVIPGRYIVKYKDGTSASAKTTHENTINIQSTKSKKKGIITKLTLPNLDGYVVDLDPSDLKQLQSSTIIDYLEKDTIVNATDLFHDSPPKARRANTIQRHVPWNLGRISHKSWMLGSSDYIYDTSAGNNVRVYVIGSGVLTTHVEFEGRATHGKNFIPNSPDTDEMGHGTCVASIVAGKTLGVAKRAQIISVKALDKNGSGTITGAIQAISWAVNDSVAKGIAKKSVIAMTMGGGYSAALNAAVLSATNAGLTFVSGAGSSNYDAKYESPASAPTSFTVGAIDGMDRRTSWSNFGTSVDIFAPGISILTANIGSPSNSATRYMTGTAMAMPHVAGLAAYLIAKENLSGQVAVTNRIITLSLKNMVGDAKGSNNRISYNGSGA
ncbi:peptidase S8/S53 domain-containing protein [Podospora fimiseda]|uniref:Peptidase S8/S53 domain-containing protein n=1 Tax=Podospora fimiseda TaxID=252190 RepID=A0AAN7BJS9_9PEZI|nr:peptidase S8/S53 domain-containing protein [Podospora fimiseda]